MACLLLSLMDQIECECIKRIYLPQLRSTISSRNDNAMGLVGDVLFFFGYTNAVKRATEMP